MAAPLPRTEDPLSALHFGVEVEGIVRAYFAECSGVSAEIKVESVEEGGQNLTTYKLPGRTNYANVTLKRGVVEDDSFVKWALDVAAGKKLRKNVTITAFTTELKAIKRWHLANAWPCKYALPQLQATGTAVIMESVELAHDGLHL